MKAIGIVGSPRHGKNTGTLVQRVLEGARSQGIETALYYIDDYEIGACKACEACKETGECAQDDDMEIFYEAIGEAKGLVLGTPIYFDQVSAQTKIFLDRLYAYVRRDAENCFPGGVKSVLVLTWEASGANAYDDVAIWLEGRLSHYYDVETVGTITAADTLKTPVNKAEDLLQQAYEAGVRLARSLR